MTSELVFPDGFTWGAATAAYQIEGAVAEDGKAPSVWDVFSHTPDAVLGGDTGDVACDHYHRWEEDVALLDHLGLGAYRFSVAWSRVIPEGTGAVNAAGLDFYDRLVDALLERGIEPFLTLCHYDLPQALEDRGGWPERATAEAFAEYAAVVAGRLGDRVHHWMTLNEPRVAAYAGYGTGFYAPGRASQADRLAAGHHMLLAHGLGMEAVRSASPGAKVGLVNDPAPCQPASGHPLDLEAAALEHALMNTWLLDPLFGRGYPARLIEAFRWDQAEVKPGDLEVIARPLDFFGLNYYTRHIVRSTDLPADAPGLITPGEEHTDMGWEVYPAGIGEMLEWLWHRYGVAEIYVTENGAAYTDDGGPPFLDERRVTYLRDHLAAVHQAIARGVPVRGYFVWSLLDNFEWSYGYSKRFGIVHVDYATQRRTVRDSGRFFSEVAGGNRLPAGEWR
ncbi:MAG: GH1 family beta-glucosidase [Acidimicrobiia bacterium]|jgi:beta-glucosidase